MPNYGYTGRGPNFKPHDWMPFPARFVRRKVRWNRRPFSLARVLTSWTRPRGK